MTVGTVAALYGHRLTHHTAHLPFRRAPCAACLPPLPLYLPSMLVVRLRRASMAARRTIQDHSVATLSPLLYLEPVCSICLAAAAAALGASLPLPAHSRCTPPAPGARALYLPTYENELRYRHAFHIRWHIESVFNDGTKFATLRATAAEQLRHRCTA